MPYCDPWRRDRASATEVLCSSNTPIRSIAARARYEVRALLNIVDKSRGTSLASRRTILAVVGCTIALAIDIMSVRNLNVKHFRTHAGRAVLQGTNLQVIEMKLTSHAMPEKYGMSRIMFQLLADVRSVAEHVLEFVHYKT